MSILTDSFLRNFRQKNARVLPLVITGHRVFDPPYALEGHAKALFRQFLGGLISRLISKPHPLRIKHILNNRLAELCTDYHDLCPEKTRYIHQQKGSKK